MTIFTSWPNNKLPETGKLKTTETFDLYLWVSQIIKSFESQHLIAWYFLLIILHYVVIILLTLLPPHISYFWDQVSHMDIKYLSFTYRPKCKLFIIWKVRQIHVSVYKCRNSFKVLKDKLCLDTGCARVSSIWLSCLKADYDTEFRVSRYEKDGDEDVMNVGVAWKTYPPWVFNQSVYSYNN